MSSGIRKTTLLEFQVNCKTQFGEELRVLGNAPTLGTWKISQAVLLVTSDKSYPIWKTPEPIPVPRGLAIEYKYLLVRNDGSLVRWEEIPKNRYFETEYKSQVTLREKFSDFEASQLRFVKSVHRGINYPPNMFTEAYQSESPQHFHDFSELLDVSSSPQIYSAGSPDSKAGAKKVFSNVAHAPMRPVETLSQQNIQQHLAAQEKLINASRSERLLKKDSYYGEPPDGFVDSEENTDENGAPPLLHKYDNDLMVDLHDDDDDEEDDEEDDEDLRKDDNTFDFSNEELKSQEYQGKRYEEDQQEIPAAFRPRKPGQELKYAPSVSSADGDDFMSGKMKLKTQSPRTQYESLLEERKKASLTTTDRVIISSFNLPVQLTKEPEEIGGASSSTAGRTEGGEKKQAKSKWRVKISDSGWASQLYSLRCQKLIPVQWIGWPGIFPDTEQDEDEIIQILREYDCVPIFLKKDEVQRFTGYFHSALQPLFHNFKSMSDDYDLSDPNDWHIFKRINEIFAMHICDVYNDGDLIWINDSELLLTANFVVRKRRSANIGLFLHGSFPSSEIYKILPYRAEILRAMLCFDLVGFHLFEYARHFLTSCKRLLGLSYECRPGGILSISYHGRSIMIRVGHIGIDLDAMRSLISSPQFIKADKVYLNSVYHQRPLIASIGHLSRLSGLKQLLRIFRRYASQTRKRSKPILILLIQPPQYETPESAKLYEELIEIKKDINNSFGRRMIYFEDKHCSRAQRMALWKNADVLLGTSLREGVNLTPFEFIATKSLCGGDRLNKPGDIVISEFSGVPNSLSQIIRINPFNTSQSVDLLEKAVESQKSQRREELLTHMAYIEKHTIKRWAKEFLEDLKLSHVESEAVVYMGMGFGFNYTRIITKSKFSQLNTDQVKSDYEQARRRLIILDHEGTLPSTDGVDPFSSSKGHEPPKAVLSVLADLCSDEKNTVFVVSGRNKQMMHKWFSRVTKLGIGAEYGFFYRWNSEMKSDRDWEQLFEIRNWDWIEAARGIIQNYTDRTDGSFVELKESALVWQYRDTDPDLGHQQANELANQLKVILSNFSVSITAGKGYVEVKPKGIDKGEFVRKLIKRKMKKQHKLDFILCVGDDESDETIFRMIAAKKRSLQRENHIIKIYTNTVGMKPSQARFYLPDPDSVHSLLDSLAACSTRMKKNKSFADVTDALRLSMKSNAQYRGSFADFSHLRQRQLKQESPSQPSPYIAEEDFNEE